MKKIILNSIFVFCLFSGVQAQSRWYTTTGGETIFSLMSFNDETNDNSVVRFSPVFNSQTLINNDISNSFGIFTGIAIRNVGFIADDPDNPDIRRKFRTYNIAVPLGLKIGNLEGFFLYGGVDAEYAFNFKEKTFINGDKENKESYWFTNRVRQFQPAVHLGVQFYRGTNIKFKYYLNSFFNPDRTDIYSSEYERFDGNIFYFSLNANLFENTKFFYSD